MNQRRLTAGVRYATESIPANAEPAPSDTSSRRAHLPARIAIAVLLVWVVAGVAVTTHRLSSSSAPLQTQAVPAPHAGHRHAPGEDIATSFGVFAVEIVDKASGLTPRELGGATHFPSYTPATQMLVTATLNITNRLSHVTDVSAAQVALRSGRTRLTPTQVSIPSVHLQPDASVDEVVTFVVPRRGQRLSLEFADTDGITVHTVDLGRATAAGTQPAPDPGHTHP